MSRIGRRWRQRFGETTEERRCIEGTVGGALRQVRDVAGYMVRTVMCAVVGILALHRGKRTRASNLRMSHERGMTGSSSRGLLTELDLMAVVLLIGVEQ